MIYLDIILTDEEDAIEITGTKDHRWVGLKDLMKKPKVSLWQLYRIKKFLETSYERLNEDQEVQDSVESTGSGVENTGE
jgi:hypothetical protein